LDAEQKIRGLRDDVAKFILERQWAKYHVPKDLSMAIAIEASELMEIFLWNQLSAADVVKDPNLKEKVGDEIADIFIYLLSLVNTLKVDLSDLVMKKMAKNRAKYPSSEFQGNYEKR
jgi:dCTP diphosphatase